MKLEQQVTSLDPSCRLKELGVKQESLFWWEPTSNRKDAKWSLQLCEFYCDCSYDDHCDAEPSGYTYNREDCISAFTVAELGEMFNRQGVGGFRSALLGKDGWICFATTVKSGEHNERADTEADARAKMLIYLLENRLITL